MLTLAISDVPGDDPATIGSGPTVPDATTLADARAVLERRSARMQRPRPRYSAGGRVDPGGSRQRDAQARRCRLRQRRISASSPRPHGALAAAAELARRDGYEVVDLGDSITGEAREVAQAHARLALAAKAAGRRVAILSGGELAVTVRNASGRGGRSQEYALALAIAIAGTVRHLRAGGRHGRHRRRRGPGDRSGRRRGRWQHAAGARLADAQKFLDNNDATAFFEAAGGLIVRGPTHTNVNDFRVILVDP